MIHALTVTICRPLYEECVNLKYGDIIVTRVKIHLDTGEPVFLPFRMSCFVFSNLVVTAGMLTPGLGVRSFLHLFVPSRKMSYLRIRLGVHAPLALQYHLSSYCLNSDRSHMTNRFVASANWYSILADRQSIPQRCHQLRQRQQVQSAEYL